MMKKLLVFLILCLVQIVLGQTVKISDSPVATTVGANDDLIINYWNGAAYVTKRINATNLSIGLSPYVLSTNINNANGTNVILIGTNYVVGAFVGNGLNLTNLSGTNILDGTIHSNKLGASLLALIGSGGTVQTNISYTSVTNAPWANTNNNTTFTGSVTASNFVGNGMYLTNLTSTNLVADGNPWVRRSTANRNLFIGYGTGNDTYTGTDTLGIGDGAFLALQGGSFNVGVGYNAGTAATNAMFSSIFGTHILGDAKSIVRSTVFGEGSYEHALTATNVNGLGHYICVNATGNLINLDGDGTYSGYGVVSNALDSVWKGVWAFGHSAWINDSVGIGPYAGIGDTTATDVIHADKVLLFGKQARFAGSYQPTNAAAFGHRSTVATDNSWAFNSESGQYKFGLNTNSPRAGLHLVSTNYDYWGNSSLKDIMLFGVGGAGIGTFSDNYLMFWGNGNGGTPWIVGSQEIRGYSAGSPNLYGADSAAAAAYGFYGDADTGFRNPGQDGQVILQNNGATNYIFGTNTFTVRSNAVVNGNLTALGASNNIGGVILTNGGMYASSINSPTGSITSGSISTLTILNQWNAGLGTNVMGTNVIGPVAYASLSGIVTNGTLTNAIGTAGGVIAASFTGNGNALTNLAIQNYAIYSSLATNATLTNAISTAGIIQATGSGTNIFGYSQFTNAVTISSNLIVSQSLIITNGPVFVPFLSGVQPVNAHGSLMMIGDETMDLSAAGQSVYLAVTNYDAMVTNLFTGSIASGVLTNTYAGWYNIRVAGSGLSTTANSQLYEGGLFTNTVECTLIEWQRSVSSTARGSWAAEGTIYLPAGCRVECKVKSDLASPDDIVLGRYTLTVSSP